VSNSNTAVALPTGLGEQVQTGDWWWDRTVKPVNNAIHQKFEFHLKVTARGGSHAWFGPFTMDYGCTASSVSFTDSPTLVTAVAVEQNSLTYLAGTS
jgi:hypothetical protein